MENGGGVADKFAGMTLNDAKESSLFQVMKAVEAAEATIRQQVEENIRLKAELQKRDQEVETLKIDKPLAPRSGSVEACDQRGNGVSSTCHATSTHDPTGTVDLHHESTPNTMDQGRHFHAEVESGMRRNNGSLNALAGGQMSAEMARFSQLSSPNATSFSPGRYLLSREYDPLSGLQGHGLMPVAESSNSSNRWNQDLVRKIRELEEEIMQLQRHLTEYSIKEAQIRNEKLVLEKRIAHMRLAFDQQQQDLVDAASKALSYRQEIIEENVRLTYALQDAQQERTTFVSSLLPLLLEYSLQPPVADAQSIVSNIKVLFKHLQEKLLITETKLRESQYQSTPWRSDGNSPNFSPLSPQHSSGAALTSSKLGLELVPQQGYSQQAYSPVNVATPPEWDMRGNPAPQATASGDDMGRNSPLSSRGYAAPGSVQAGMSQDGMRANYKGDGNRQVKFKDPVTSSERNEQDVERHYTEGEYLTNWGTVSSHSNTPDEPGSSYSPYLQPVPEEPDSSYSEAADDDPLPAIQGLQITGEAYPGQGILACGYSVNGTTSCNFEWIRHLEDGSVNYIEGAKQPNYLVTADDVDTYLAIEVQPLDDRKRKGGLVKVFANEHRKIACDPAMHDHIEGNMNSGHASYKVSLSTGYLDIWEPATLTIKRDSYTIKSDNGSNGVVVNEKLSPGITVMVIYGQATDFSIANSSRVVHLRAENIMEDISSLRDAIVLTLRLFILKAGEKKKGKRRGLFFNK